MSRCRKCNIEILDETERCPLCNSVLEQTVELENMYPNVRIMARKLMLISRIYLFAAILLEVLLVYINVVSDAKTWWSLITALGFIYVYMLLRFAILGKSGYRGKVVILTMIAVLIALAADFVIGYGQLRASGGDFIHRYRDSGFDVLQPEELAELHYVAAFYDPVQRCAAGVFTGRDRDVAVFGRACLCGVGASVPRHADYRGPAGAHGA